MAEKEYIGGTRNQWHIHDVGTGHIKMGNKRLNFDGNNPVQNWRQCQDALLSLDNMPDAARAHLPNYDELREAIQNWQQEHTTPPPPAEHQRWSDEARAAAQEWLAENAAWLNKPAISKEQYYCQC